MINLELEKSLALNSQERYDVISFAIDAADDNGFINSFILERALYVYAAIMLYPESKEEYSSLAATNILSAWNKLIEDGFIHDLIIDYQPTLDVLGQEAQVWCEEYADWAHSARGILDMVQQFTGDFVGNAATALKQSAEESGVEEVINIANDWGMGRDALKPASKIKALPKNEESLFNQQ